MPDVATIYVIGLSLTIIGMLGGGLFWLGGEFREIRMRFKQIDERFREIDRRFDELRGYVDDKFNELKGYIDSRVNRLSEAFSSYQEFFIELLMTEGVIKPEKAVIAKNEARRIMRLATSTNPLTKEEWKRLGELLDKDPNDLTYEEALELRELARKVIREYMDYAEAWKLLMYASMMVGLTKKKREEQGGG
jgi:tetratricopeptide (TPR) repeat protein